MLDGGCGVRVTLPKQTHWVIASGKRVSLRTEHFAFRGTAGVVKRRADGRMSLNLLSEGRIECRGQVLASPGAARLELPKGK